MTISNTGITAIGTGKVTSGMILDGTVSDTDLASPNNVTYKMVHTSGGFATGLGITTTKIVFALATTSGVSSGGSGTAIADLFYLVGADNTVAGKSQQLRVRAQCLTNTTAPGVTITFGLYPITASAGAASQVSFTIGNVIAGSTVAFVTPALSTQNQANSGDFAVPADGYYALGYVGSGSQAASSAVALTAQLQTRNT